MLKHSFLHTPGYWVGEGKISLNMVEENLMFITHWNILSRDFSGKIQGTQDIQIQGLSDQMKNELSFYDFHDQKFSVDMENENVGRVVGTGVYNEKVIAWEFRDNDMSFEGFESYHMQSDGSYLVQAEFITTEQLRTQIEGRIWQQTKPSTEPAQNEEEDVE